MFDPGHSSDPLFVLRRKVLDLVEASYIHSTSVLCQLGCVLALIVDRVGIVGIVGSVLGTIGSVLGTIGSVLGTVGSVGIVGNIGIVGNCWP